MSDTVDGKVIHDITMKEREITGAARPVKGGPTAQAQKHLGDKVEDQVISDVANGETAITHDEDPLADGPTTVVQSKISSDTSASTQAPEHPGKLDSATISTITAAEKKITGNDDPAPGGPTAQAQKHAGEDIGHDNLHDITEGEKKITGNARPVKGGPTAVAQSELAKHRQDN